jgi:mannobiose 2-epimerase
MINNTTMCRYYYACFIYLAVLLNSCSRPGPAIRNPGDISSKILSCLENDELKYWYPRVIDTLYGGYLSRFSYDWKADTLQNKYLVYEARHLWTTSFISENYPEKKQYLDYARNGFNFLKDHTWDIQYGGFYIATDRKGKPLAGMINEKRIYGQAFSLYALSRYYHVSRDTAALELARKEFLWMEINAHDSKYGGYWEFLKRNGKPFTQDDKPASPFIDNAVRGFKDYNSSIHLLEALSAFYSVWPDSLVKIRLEEMLNIVSKKMIHPDGYLIQFFYDDWTPVPPNILKQKAGKDLWFTDHITFGHDIETAYLLLDATESLGIEDSLILPVSVRLTEHTLKFGWDKINGGIFDKGLKFSNDSVRIIDTHKSWWGEMEALNTLLLMSIKVPENKARYYQYFTEQWNYIDQYLIDHTNGEFYNYGTDTDAGNKTAMKAHDWKASYHTTRSLVNCLNLLNRIRADSLTAK